MTLETALWILEQHFDFLHSNVTLENLEINVSDPEHIAFNNKIDHCFNEELTADSWNLEPKSQKWLLEACGLMRTLRFCKANYQPVQMSPSSVFHYNTYHFTRSYVYQKLNYPWIFPCLSPQCDEHHYRPCCLQFFIHYYIHPKIESHT